MKYFVSILFSLTLLFALTSLAFGENSPTATSSENRKVADEAIKIAKTASHEGQLSNFKLAGDKYIQSRIDALNKLLARINSDSHLSTSDKSTLSAEVNLAITGLRGLKTKTDADVSVDVLKTDVKSIFTSYRIFDVLTPQVEGLLATNKVTQISKLQAVADKLTTMIAKLKSAGKDTIQMSALLSDYKLKVADAKTKIDLARTSFEAMKVTDPTAAKTSLQAGKNALKDAKADLTAAHKDLESIIPLLKAANTNKSSTESATH